MDSPNKTFENAKIIVVDDTPANLDLLVEMLKVQGYQVKSAPSGKFAIDIAKNDPPDLILLDINMPEMNGYEVCKILKADRVLHEIPVVFISALSDTFEKLEAFSVGGVDYITKPFHLEEVYARVATHIKLHKLQAEMEEYNEKLEQIVAAQVKEIFESQMATIFAIAKLAESRDDDTGKHLERVQMICRAIALKLSMNKAYSTLITRTYAENIFYACPLHDIGKVAIPDNILLKPSKLTPEEFEIMKTHAALGAETLTEVLDKYPNNHFIKMGIAIARYHHERWDGKGYPDGLAKNNIPLSARIMSVVDVYEAVRSKRCYKPSLPHNETCEIIVKGTGTQFDPDIIAAFWEIQEEISRIYDSIIDFENMRK
jgi:putative two-component system response regulator